MARKKTKKQKRVSDTRKHVAKVSLGENGMPVVTSSKRDVSKKNTTTKLDQTQVSLVYRDLLKTAVVTLVVFVVLLFIFVYMR